MLYAFFPSSLISKTSLSKKRQKVDTECRTFPEQWTYSYIFILSHISFYVVSLELTPDTSPRCCVVITNAQNDSACGLTRGGRKRAFKHFWHAVHTVRLCAQCAAHKPKAISKCLLPRITLNNLCALTSWLAAKSHLSATAASVKEKKIKASFLRPLLKIIPADTLLSTGDK